MVGGSPTWFTVTVKVAALVFVPSLTLTVMVEAPVRLVAGLMARARLVPLPPKTMLAFGTRFVLEELPVTVTWAGVFSGSPMVKEIGPVTVSSLVVTSEMREMLGESFTGLTFSTKLVWAAPKWLSVTRTVTVEARN